MSQQLERPGSVSLATNLIFLTIAVGLVRSYMEFDIITAANPNVSVGFVVTVAAITFAITIAIAMLINSGKNWARIIFAGLVVIGIPLSIKPIMATFDFSPALGSLAIGQAILQVIAIILLFLSPSSRWFAEKKQF